MMELDNQQQPNPMKVMTDEQLETLRKQIAIYATICERLVEMHKTLTSQQDLAGGGRMVSLYADPSIGHKMTARQRWTPTPMQLQILERLFDQDTGTPSKQKIKDLTEELSQHGQIAEQNICNWFQNRRARSKRKQHCGVGSSNNKNGEGESPEMSSDLHLLGVQSNPRDEHLVESYNLYDHVEDYDMSG
ncbi:hypothetical protein HID58_056528 [Brassica napus]|uniref:Homeobox domain-containing protein n=1 Tax=Brassica napus TaxID=3708 RepID=A0ABQ8ANH8_BRANA|nr:hypothetical protein HID58_056528 [Brassica napus]